VIHDAATDLEASHIRELGAECGHLPIELDGCVEVLVNNFESEEPFLRMMCKKRRS
jgi:hypothetical protein